MVAPQLYPLSTQDGKAVPLDVVRPIASFFLSLEEGVEKEGEIPAEFIYAWIYSTAACFIQFGATLPEPMVEDTIYENATFIPADTVTVLVLTPGAVSVLPLDDGVITFNKIEQWAALTQSRQSSLG